jgi:uncharacterized SAM-binding protein YcdF (DUF218 family)
MKKKGKGLRRILKMILLISGSIFLVLILLALTTLPYWAYYDLGTCNSKIIKPPTTIVLLSGTGIPSEGGLMRAYITARLAKANPDAEIMISIPGSLTDSTKAPLLTAKELLMRGIKKERLHFENQGRNTRDQAQRLAAGKTTAQLSLPITLVTSPEHMKRAVLTFRKCGYTFVSGRATFETALETDLTFRDSDLKGNKYIPAIGDNLQVRYQFWNQLKFEVLVLREYFGLAFYKLRGWI